MAKDEAKALLIGFNFNVNAALGTVLYKAIEVDSVTGEIKIAALTHQKYISLPSGASHILLKSRTEQPVPHLILS